MPTDIFTLVSKISFLKLLTQTHKYIIHWTSINLDKEKKRLNTFYESPYLLLYRTYTIRKKKMKFKHN